MPVTHTFSPEVSQGIDELLKKDSYSQLSKDVNIANLEIALTSLIGCVQRISTEKLSVTPIAVPAAISVKGGGSF